MNGGKHFTQAAGDFLLFSSESLLGFDEQVNFSDVYTDARFCHNWSATRSGGDCYNWHFFKSIGRVFKADHELMFVKTKQLENHPKGMAEWNTRFKASMGSSLYSNDKGWGLIEEPQTQICEGVWYIG
jgi:hypothetical protein